jgi:hypothetical protein
MGCVWSDTGWSPKSTVTEGYCHFVSLAEVEDVDHIMIQTDGRGEPIAPEFIDGGVDLERF